MQSGWGLCLGFEKGEEFCIGSWSPLAHQSHTQGLLCQLEPLPRGSVWMLLLVFFLQLEVPTSFFGPMTFCPDPPPFLWPSSVSSLPIVPLPQDRFTGFVRGEAYSSEEGGPGFQPQFHYLPESRHSGPWPALVPHWLQASYWTLRG